MSTNKDNTELKVYKPISMVRDELMDKLTQAANESGLPWCIVEYVVKDFLSRVSMAATQQTIQDEQNYQKQLKEQSDENLQKTKDGDFGV